MTEEPESIDNQKSPQASEPESVSPMVEKGSISDLRETLTEEEAEKDQAPKKTGIFQKVTGVLRGRTGSLVKSKKSTTGPLTSAEPKVPTPAFTSDEIPTVTAAEEISAVAPFSEDLDQNPEVPAGDNLDESSSQTPESSIFDLLYQVRQSGLVETEKPQSIPETEPGFSEPAQKESETTVPNTSQPNDDALTKEKNDLSDEVITTSSLASRLWGLQEESEQPSTEPDLSSGESDQTMSKASMDEQEEKTGFFDRIRGIRGDEKSTKPIEFDDDTFLNRVSRSTGELHDLPEYRKPPSSTSGSASGKDLDEVKQSHEEGDEETGRFVFYNQESEDEVSPFITAEPEDHPSAEENQEAEVEPFTTSTPGERFNLEEFLATNLTTEPDEDFKFDTHTDFTGLDYGSWGGSVPEIEKQDSQPAEEIIKPDDNLDKIRAIALETYAVGSEDMDGSSGSSSGASSDSIGEMIVAQPRKSWWKSLPVFERIIIGVVAALVLVLAGIAGFSANKFWQQPAPPAVILPTITPSTLPSPVEIILPGAWSFELSSSAVAVAPDKPGTGIWLMGSEVRRIVELPWNKQTEAVIQTFTPGDLIQVKFDDGSVINYKVDQVTQVDATDTSILTDNKPSLVIILAGQKDAQRWVVIARP